MYDLVFHEPNKIDAEPFTTSKAISEFSGAEHRKLKVTIRKHENEIKTFELLYKNVRKYWRQAGGKL